MSVSRPFLPRPVAGNARGIAYRGKRAYLGDVLDFNGISRGAYNERISRGWERLRAMEEPVNRAISRAVKARWKGKRAP